MKKNPRVEVLRGIAILAVVLIHTCPRDPAWQIGFRPFINFGVPTFLFLSGWLTQKKPQTWYLMCTKRIPRVLLPYIIWTIIYTLINKDYGAFLYNTLTANAVYTLYYIPVYIQFVLLTPLMERLSTSRFKWIGHLITPLSFVIFTYHPGVFGDRINLIFHLSFLGWFAYYYLGLICGHITSESSKLIKWCSLLLIFFLLAQIGENLLWWRVGMPDIGTPMKITALISILLFLILLCPYLRNKNGHTSAVLQVIGKYSFGIYLIHPLVIRLLPPLPFGINTFFTIISSLFMVWALHYLLGDRISRWLGLI